MKTVFRKKRLDEILIEQGLLDQKTLNEVLQRVNHDHQRLGAALLEEGSLTEENLAQALAAQHQRSYVPLTDFRLDAQFFKMIPVELMYRYPFIPLKDEKGVLTIVVADPGNLLAMDELEVTLKRDLAIVVSTKTAILEALKRSEGSSQVLKKIEADFHPEIIREDEKGDEVLSVEKLSKDLSPVIRLVDSMILNAMQKRASDIHIEASDKEVAVKYRIDGVLYRAMEPLDTKFHAPLISRIKVMSELDIAEKRVPQDGRFKMRLEGKKVDFRVSILPSIFGEDVVIRILDKEYITASVSELRLDRLGFNQEDLKKFRKSIVEPHGMALVTGPTGSGKTT
ncbi:MAG TPA: ATPase, T2SS/T4P/T4SS family, partial [Nitrospiria bacterium]|nr:ATPase, T2SS/T4P/T4SS family [Nitrospiria bacterium]